MPPIHFQRWAEEHRHLLQPPVGNKLLFKENGFIVMAVGGPNSRTDFHYNEGPEFFYQVKGMLVLKLFVNNKILNQEVREGEIFLLPPKVPHSPQREKDSVGLVLERSRLASEKDGLLWYCQSCDHLLYENYFSLKNIETDFPPVFDTFYSSESTRTCKKCGAVHPAPKKEAP